MRRRWTSVRGQRGSIGLSAIAALVIGLILILGMATISLGVLTSGRRTARLRSLNHLAESGIQYGYWQYVYNSVSAPYALTRAFGPGSMTVSVTNNNANLKNTFKVVGTGAINNEQYTKTRIFATPLPNYPSGFAGAKGLTLNGSAQIVGSRLRLTDNNPGEAGSVFSAYPVNLASFQMNLSFQLTSAVAEGFTICFQNYRPTALGSAGMGLGYAGIPQSFCLKADLYNNAGEGSESSGGYAGGAMPTTPAIDMSLSGIDMHNGHVFTISMNYSGVSLAVSITDTGTGWTQAWVFVANIPAYVGSTSSYVGFTASTGSQTATQEILTWTYSS